MSKKEWTGDEIIQWWANVPLRKPGEVIYLPEGLSLAQFTAVIGWPLNAPVKEAQERSLKFDTEKLPLHLVDPLWLKATAAVLAFGAKKYSAWNWAKGTFSHSQLYRAAIGHLQAYWEGEDFDPETGLPHIWHANCCLMFLTRYTHDNLGTDDRWPFADVQAMHPGTRSLAEQGYASGGSTRRTRREAWDTLRRTLREGVRPDARRSGLEPGGTLHDQRVLDQAAEQQTRNPLHEPDRMEKLRQSLRPASAEGRQQVVASSPAVPSGIGTAIARDHLGEPQPDNSLGQYRPVGPDRAPEHLPGPGDNLEQQFAAVFDPEKVAADISPSSGAKSLGPAADRDSRPGESKDPGGVPGAAQAQEGDPGQSNALGTRVISKESGQLLGTRGGRRD